MLHAVVASATVFSRVLKSRAAEGRSKKTPSASGGDHWNMKITSQHHEMQMMRSKNEVASASIVAEA